MFSYALYPFVSVCFAIAAIQTAQAARSPAALRDSSSVAQRASDAQTAIERTRRLVDEIRTTSYTELRDASFEIKTFASSSDYFRASFSFGRFFTGRKMRYAVLVNPKVFDLPVPEAGVRAILAHELGHAFYFKQRNRIELLGLARLISKKFMI